MKTLVEGFRGDRSGTTAIEYALVAGAVAAALFGALPLVGVEVTAVWDTVGSALDR